uniref:Uncharacterized protein n=1 Tax=Caloglossa beccarii TaxID=131038 RepID=A0A1Z1M8A7_9FLOR|nr:hypothetical protein [Caloglossa beccarii]ARW62210.1 hypothetical protein [Caloglossa beccarii]
MIEEAKKFNYFKFFFFLEGFQIQERYFLLLFSE